MRNYIKIVFYLFVFAGFNLAEAGSYEDFFVAVKRDDPAAIGQLLKRGFDPNTPSPDGQSALYLAVKEPSLKAAQVLIEWPATKVESRNQADESPLMMASLKGQVDIVRKLIARDADVNKTGWAPLHYAATNGHLEVMQLLLDNHAYIDAESPNKTTPLMMAASYGSTAGVKLLLDAGADPLLKNTQGLGAIDFAQRVGRTEVVELIAASVRRVQPKGRW